MKLLTNHILQRTIVNAKTNRTLLAGLLSCLLLSACSTHHGAARIISIPAGAQVVSIDDGSVLGTTPLVINYKNNNSDRLHLPVKVIMDGYYDKVSSFWLAMRHASQRAAANEPKVVQLELTKRGSALN